MNLDLRQLNGYTKDASEVVKIAKKHGWRLVQIDPKTYMLGFKLNETKYPRINVYLTKMTFVTQINHPRKGKNQLFRRRIYNPKLVNKIFRITSLC